MELGPYGIRANTISPGLTATDANAAQRLDSPEAWEKRSQGIPLGRVGAPSDHVGAAVFLASADAAWVTGANIIIDGGMAVI